MATHGRLLNTILITASGTYTPTPGTSFFKLFGQGCAGGSAGCPAGGGVNVFASVGGASGSAAQAIVTSVSASYTVTIGAPGAAGTNAPGNGGNGAQSTFAITAGATIMTLPGGQGSVVPSAAMDAVSGNGFADSTATGANVASVGGGATQIFVEGGRHGEIPLGSPGLGTIQNAAGADSFLGTGGRPVSVSGDTVGAASTGFGAGPAGSVSLNNAVAGQIGGSACFIVEEYS